MGDTLQQWLRVNADTIRKMSTYDVCRLYYYPNDVTEQQWLDWLAVYNTVTYQN